MSPMLTVLVVGVAVTLTVGHLIRESVIKEQRRESQAAHPSSRHQAIIIATVAQHVAVLINGRPVLTLDADQTHALCTSLTKAAMAVERNQS